jgi:hypothetical protein
VTGPQGATGPGATSTTRTYTITSAGALFAVQIPIVEVKEGNLVTLQIGEISGTSGVTSSIYTAGNLLYPPTKDTNYIVPVIVGGGDFTSGLMRIYNAGQIIWYSSVAGAKFAEGDECGFLTTTIQYVTA